MESLPENVLLELSRTGGIEGHGDLLTIGSDGAVVLETHRGTYRENLPGTELQRVKDAIAKRDYDVDTSSAPNPPPPDWLEVSCRVRGDRETVKIKLDRGAIAEVVSAIERRAEATSAPPPS